MKFTDFRKKMLGYPVFNLRDLRLILANTNFTTLAKQLATWTKKGQLIRLKNGVYLLSPDFLPYNVQALFLASKLYYPSYVSLQYVLSYYGIMPEATFEITSVSSGTTRRFVTPLGTYSYRHLKPEYFFGFESRQVKTLTYYFAEKEKALLDYMYLNSARLQPESATWENLRFDNLQEVNFAKLHEYASRFHHKKLSKLALSLENYAESH